MNNGKNCPFRYDTVGSFLRPKKLHEARSRFEKGEITSEELKAVEDACIRDLIARQKKAGLKAITDGEFRRAWWHMDFFWGLNGIEKKQSADGLHFHGEVTKPDTAAITGKISGENHPFAEHFKYTNSFADKSHVAKQTIPAPTQLLAQLRMPEFAAQNKSVYPDDNALKKDIATAYRTVIKELYEAGCRNLQLDDCTWTLYADKTMWPAFGMTDALLKIIAEEGVELNNEVLKDKPAGMVISTHVCRGNFHSTYANTGPYDPIAPYLFAKEDVDAFYLEYDTDRAGGFEPLKYVPEDKMVVLGLVTTKKPELEDEDALIRRIHQAALHHPLEKLALSPQCGFASTEEGNKLTEEEEWEKVSLVKKTAEKVWKDAGSF